jgi:hypothetical protein
MTAAIKSAISPFAQPEPEPNANAIRFLDERLTSVPASDIPEDFRKLSRYLPVIVLVPKSAVGVPPEVTEACSVWVKHVRAVAIDEYKKMKKGHAVSRPALQKPREQDK